MYFTMVKLKNTRAFTEKRKIKKKKKFPTWNRKIMFEEEQRPSNSPEELSVFSF